MIKLNAGFSRKVGEANRRLDTQHLVTCGRHSLGFIACATAATGWP